MWLCAVTTGDQNAVAINAELTFLDEMWHTFILFTRDYAQFCHRYLGGYIHHAPTTYSEKKQTGHQFQKNFDDFLNQRKSELKDQYSIIYDYLGEETLIKWYETYGEKYTKEYIKSVRK